MKYWEDKNVFITGAFGFVGSWLTKQLIDNKANIFVLEHRIEQFSNFDYLNLKDEVKRMIPGSITNLDLLKEILKDNNIDTCFHLAAQALVEKSIGSPLPTFEANIAGTWNVLDACRVTESVERVVVASSDKAYGRHKDLPYKENFPLLPADPYSTSKACADLIAQAFGKIYGMPVGITRFANIYGGGDFNFSRIIPSAAKSIVFNQNPQLTSDGTPVRDFIYISDAISGYLRLAGEVNHNNVKGEAFNFTGENPTNMLDLINRIIRVSGKHLQPEILRVRDQSKEIDVQYLSCEKVKRVLKWKPVISLDEGLKKTLKWYQMFFNSDFYKKSSN